MSLERQTFEDAIEKAKLAIIRSYDRKGSVKRIWKEAAIDFGGDMIKFIVREGSPPKGWIVVNYGMHTVTAYDVHERKLYTWRNLIDLTSKSPY